MINPTEILFETLSRGKPWLVLSGAGISIASGIPSYRDDEGRWLAGKPIKHDEFLKDLEKRQRYWSRSFFGWPRIKKAVPNKTHLALASLEKAGVLKGIVTQNVDRLHQQAGSKLVVDLHGRLDRVRCIDCGELSRRSKIQSWLEVNNTIPERDTELEIRPDGDAELSIETIRRFQTPSCEKCSGILMPDVIFFGGTIPSSRVRYCEELINDSAGILVIGSSLAVYSGFRLCKYGAKRGKDLVILNRGPTRADSLCSEKFKSNPFTILEKIARLMTKD